MDSGELIFGAEDADSAAYPAKAQIVRRMRANLVALDDVPDFFPFPVPDWPPVLDMALLSSFPVVGTVSFVDGVSRSGS